MIQGMALNRNSQMENQAIARIVCHGGAAEGRSHGGECLNATMRTSGGGGADGGGAFSVD